MSRVITTDVETFSRCLFRCFEKCWWWWCFLVKFTPQWIWNLSVPHKLLWTTFVSAIPTKGQLNIPLCLFILLQHAPIFDSQPPKGIYDYPYIHQNREKSFEQFPHNVCLVHTVPITFGYHINIYLIPENLDPHHFPTNLDLILPQLTAFIGSLMI